MGQSKAFGIAGILAITAPALAACGGSGDEDRSTAQTGADGRNEADAGRDSGMAPRFGTCADTPPPGAPQAPDPKPYSGGNCPVLTTGPDNESTITSSGKERQFMVIVPDDIGEDEKLPVVFLWHWLNASAHSFYERAFVEEAVNQQRFIAVIPESIGQLLSDWRGWSTLNPESDEEEEFVFFDDMLACVSEQFPVNKNCVSSAGVSDGALWTSQLIGGRGEYLSSAIVLSGGVNNPDDDTNGAIREYIPSTDHVMPAIILWGGPSDTFIINFEPATKSLEEHMQAEGHFIIECQHNCGHDEPPFEPPPGESKFAAFWDFVSDHPYWTPPGESPYEEAGLPGSFPEWCALGVGNAEPRVGGDCANLVTMALGGGSDAGP